MNYTEEMSYSDNEEDRKDTGECEEDKSLNVKMDSTQIVKVERDLCFIYQICEVYIYIYI
jgi:hypothetical protein